MRGVALREPSGPRARADLQYIRFIFSSTDYLVHCFVLLVKQMFRTWGCVVVPCFCSEGIGRKLPSPEIIFQTPDHQKHDNMSQIQLV